MEDISEVYVYCSNPDIQKYIPDGVKYLKRSESLDQDTTKMNEVLQSFAEDVQADIYVMTHTTAPFISVESIIKGLKAVQGESMTHLSQQRNCKIFYGRMVCRSIIN